MGREKQKIHEKKSTNPQRETKGIGGTQYLWVPDSIQFLIPTLMKLSDNLIFEDLNFPFGLS